MNCILAACKDDANLLELVKSKTRPKCLSKEQKKMCVEYDNACEYIRFVLRCRSSRNILAALAVAAPRLAIKVDQLDSNGFSLNTPSDTYDLRKGVDSPRPHNPDDYITQITNVAPGTDGMEIWDTFLRQIFCEDEDLIRYIHQVCGLIAIGHVYVEAMIVAVGNGRNGKSTFFNVVAKVLDTYSGSLSALYKRYRDYCEAQYETPKSTTAFYNALSSAGFRRVLQNRRSVIIGLALKAI